MSTDKQFELLHPTVQRWVYKQGWTDLHQIQKEAIGPILSGQTDLIISAPTAGGKTEAAFLPACTAISEITDGFGILYISPLKALINDQFRRLESLCEMLDMRLTPWHGDSPQSAKKVAKRMPKGIVLITPESLESLLIRESGWVRTAFESLKYVIVDEYHAFIGFERGHHLQSLLTRLEHLLDRQKAPIPRIALSATLGDMKRVRHFLRPNQALQCELIEDKETRSTMEIQVRGYLNVAPDSSATSNGAESHAFRRVADDLYQLLRGDSHLVFANSRSKTEYFAALLSDLCEDEFVPNEFFPHHGSLAKELRGDVERRLQKEKLPTTAVCTMTLELGIDIGKVNSISQVAPPHSVSSLRQRLGRSGRRGDPARLRMFIVEDELTVESSLGQRLRIQLLQSIAMIRLLLRKWYEPPDSELFHFSTLLHQVLAIIAQWGGVRADQLWALLRRSGPFQSVTVEHFKALLSEMGAKNLIFQLPTGELVLGELGERLVNHYSFYAVFETPQEFRIIVREGGRILGTLPIEDLVPKDQHLIFGGRRWRVLDVDIEGKAIYVASAAGGKPPSFGGKGLSVHSLVRQEMLEIYNEGDYRVESEGIMIDFLDCVARNLFAEGLSSFRELQLERKRLINSGRKVYLLPWMGDKIVNTLTMVLMKDGFRVSNFAGIIEIEDASHSSIFGTLLRFTDEENLSNSDLARLSPNKETEKFDHLLHEDLLNDGYGVKAFDVRGTIDWLKEAIYMEMLQPS